MKIFIIDDNRINNFICENIIKQLQPDAEITCFENGVNAESQLIEYQNDISLVLLDLNMPLVDGWDLLEKLKERNIKLFIVILTSSINIDDRERAMKFENVKGFITKPATFEKIEEQLILTKSRD
ncbi:MAG: response regulator [Cytophagales bacterium]